MILLETHQLAFNAGKLKYLDINLTIHAGEQWGILGPNGCGKTTLLLTLAGLLPYHSGEILIQNQSITHLTPKQRAQSRTLLFQDHTFTFPQTVWDYCLSSRYPHHAHFRQPDDTDLRIIEESLSAMELTTHAERNICQLSGGEQRRLAIAAALAQTPNLYLLDEPINHLDIRHQIKTLDYFRKLTHTKEKASIITLHDINLAQQYCTHLILMHQDGQLEHGRTEEILNETKLTALYGCKIEAMNSTSAFFWPANN